MEKSEPQANRDYQDCLSEIAKLHTAVRALYAEGEKAYRAACAEAVAKLPKVGKRPKKPVKLSAEQMDPIRAELLQLWEPALVLLQKELAWVEALRDAKAAAVAVTPGATWHRVATADTSTYFTQTNAVGYARGELRPLEARLADLGVSTRVEEHFGTSIHGTFELWAQCEPYMADAVERSLSVAYAVWAFGTLNPNVYMPFYQGEWPIPKPSGAEAVAAV